TDGAAIDTPITLPNTNESRTYDLDGLGNWRRTTFTPVGGSESKEVRQHNALNQITSIKEGSDPKVPFTYDLNGNLTNDGTRTYEWDALNRLKKVYKTPSSAVLIAEYTYDALGRRIRKTVSNGGLGGSIPNETTDYVYHSGIAQCCEERQEIATVDTPTKQYVWGIYIDELIQQKNLVALNNFSAAVELYPLQDTLYRTTALADSAGAIREAYDCDAYGNTLIFRKSGSPPSVISWADGDTQIVLPTSDYIYTGRQYDAESEVYFYRARFHSQHFGRFISRDLIDSVAELYTFVRNNPVVFVDPSGLQPPPNQPPCGTGFKKWDYRVPPNYGYRDYHGQQACRQPQDNCIVLLRKLQAFITAGAIRRIELIADVNKLRTTNPVGYNNHIDQLKMVNRHIINCWVQVKHRCPNPPESPNEYSLPSKVALPQPAQAPQNIPAVIPHVAPPAQAPQFEWPSWDVILERILGGVLAPAFRSFGPPIFFIPEHMKPRDLQSEGYRPDIA
ncbi:MAG: hypothetical protein K8T91_03240, partial [Planctomycetes bacterium]|nr:hypothetical protein [Planctomycetota bacterium]